MSGRARCPHVLRATAAVLIGASLLACGGTSAEEQRERLAEDLVDETDGALGDGPARCVADSLFDEFGGDSFERVLEAASGADDDEDDEIRTRVIDIFAGCDALAPIIDDTP